jgi:hypothetical protein
MERITTNLIYLTLNSKLSYKKYFIRIRNKNYISITNKLEKLEKLIIKKIENG